MKKTTILIFLIITIILIYSGIHSNSQEQITLPVKAHIVTEETGAYTSFRTEENIKQTFIEANRIWEQAAISFQLKEIVKTNVSFQAIPNAINGNHLELYNNQNHNHAIINVYFVQSLNSINGIALYYLNGALIADQTTVNDYRTLAHELGHLLELKHLPDPTLLMAQGRNGEQLTDQEIITARQKAKHFPKKRQSVHK